MIQLPRMLILATSLLSTYSIALPIAPIEQALTLAQLERNGKVHTLLVLEDDGATISAVDLSQSTGEFPIDSLMLVRKQGVDALARYASANLPRLSVPYSELLPATGIAEHHIGVGINYPEHGKEVDIASVPFLFPKLIKGSGARGSILTNSTRLLDYEAELCVRFDRDVQNEVDLDTAMVGVFLCGDFTDRASLMRLMDTTDAQSGLGFTDAKSLPDYFPTGPYLVVPLDWQRFVGNIRLQLFVNGELRQDGAVSDMIWSIEQIATMALETGTESRWQYQGNPVPLLSAPQISIGTTLLTGTPDGVIFRPPSGGYIFWHGLKYLFTGSFFRSGPRRYVIEQYIGDLLEARQFLQPRDSVRLQANWLGNIEIDVTTTSDRS